MRRRGWGRFARGGDNTLRLEQLESAIDRLRETAEYGTIVVEGARDRAALEWLGVGGLHIQIHRGQSLELVFDELAQSPQPIILLLDWDRKGAQLTARLEENLRARVHVDTECRRRIAIACQCRCLEELPAELQSLRNAT